MGTLLLTIAYRATKVFARLLLCLLLIAQLGILWVVTHPTPTRLPPSALSVLSEVFAGQLSFTCREASVDNRGRIRLSGARLAHDEHPGDILYADLDFTPNWSKLLTGELAFQSMEARGRATLGEVDSLIACDDFVIRLGNTQGSLVAQSAARVGSMILRADIILPLSQHPSDPADPVDSAANTHWNRNIAINCLKVLRSFEGSLTLNIAGPHHATYASAVFIENPASMSSLPLTAKRGALRITFEETLHVQLHLQGLNAWDANAEDVWVFLDNQKNLHAYLSNIQVDGLARANAHIAGKWHDAATQTFALNFSTNTSWVQATILTRKDGITLEDSYAHIAATDLIRFIPIAKGAQEIGVDLSGPIDLLGTEIQWDDSTHLRGHGSFAFSKLGWKDIRPSRIRPESKFATFTGDFAFATDKNTLSLRQLNLAGLCGEIDGGLHANDAYTIRLNSTEGNPINTSCLNSLLGEWWKDLWSRFDLSTTGTRPHADVLVKGKWGASYADKVLIRTTLENFGFMGGRFTSADLWVLHTPQSTTVRIDSLQGELEGKSAGTARGTIEWDSQKPEWNGQPRIQIEGDIQPAFILRLHDVSIANQLRDWKFPKPRLRLTLEADHSLQLHLSGEEPVTLAGVQVDKLEFDLTKNPTGSEITLHATGGITGGRATIDLKGDMAHRNTLSVSIVDWSRTGLTHLTSSLQGRLPDKQGPKDRSNLMAFYQGTLDVDAPWETEGDGLAILTDPHLKTVHLFGGLSEGLDALGLGFSSYPLERAELAIHCKAGIGDVKRLDLIGPDASLKFKGKISLQDGSLNLAGQMKVAPSSLGPLGLLNPNRLIASMINIYVGGTMRKPVVSLKKPTK